MVCTPHKFVNLLDGMEHWKMLWLLASNGDSQVQAEKFSLTSTQDHLSFANHFKTLRRLFLGKYANSVPNYHNLKH